MACTPQYIITCNARILAFSPRAFNKVTSIYTSRSSSIPLYHINFYVQSLYFYVCLVLFTSHRQRGYLETAPHLLSLSKNVKPGKYTVPTGIRAPGRRVAVHYATTAPHKLLLLLYRFAKNFIISSKFPFVLYNFFNFLFLFIVLYCIIYI